MDEFNNEQQNFSEEEINEPELQNDNPNFSHTNFHNEKIVYSDYSPAPTSRGLKIFAFVLAAIIALTSFSAIGYFLGKSSNNTVNKNISLNLKSKPKNTDEFTAEQIYGKTVKHIVGVYAYNSAGTASQASGVVYTNDGYIVTNDHIYANINSPKFKVIAYDGSEYDAKYVAGDTVSDLAVLKVDTKNLKAATFGNSDELNFGETVVAIGKPNGASGSSSITQGIISSVSERVKTTSNYTARLIQTDSAINPGSSGGALINMYGQVVGITSSKLAGVQYDSVGYAIPTTILKRVVDELIKNGKVISRAKLGITYTAIDSLTAEINNLDFTGLKIADISQDSDLYGKAVAGDYIVKINDTVITNDTVVLDIIESKKAGETVNITVKTANGSVKNYTVKLKANIGESSYSTDPPEISTPKKSSENPNEDAFSFPEGE